LFRIGIAGRERGLRLLLSFRPIEIVSSFVLKNFYVKKKRG